MGTPLVPAYSQLIPSRRCDLPSPSLGNQRNQGPVFDYRRSLTEVPVRKQTQILKDASEVCGYLSSYDFELDRGSLPSQKRAK